MDTEPQKKKSTFMGSKKGKKEMSRKRDVCINSNGRRCLMIYEATCQDCRYFREEDHEILKVIYDAPNNRMKILFDFLDGERKATSWITNVEDYASGRILEHFFWDGSVVEITLKDVYNIDQAIKTQNMLNH